ncbi:MAG: hypothetical protein BWY19_00026 [bacterium ADurb.Bin212]|nr:MAG: hypothetical protein BWY19_00026 [bacterium ADurb.Bin212]
MLNLIAALRFCGFVSDLCDSPCADDEVWVGGQRYQDAIGVPDDWGGWLNETEVKSWWREYPEGNEVAFDEIAIYPDRIVIIDRTHQRMAVTCHCEPEGCALAAELVRAWFATGR